jgi:hypothetical protein
MPARRPEHARRIELPATPAPAEPTAEEIQQRTERRRNAILSGGPMRSVIQAVIEAGEPLEIDTGTHIVTITVAEK